MPPQEWAIGHTFEFTFSLPQPGNAGGRPTSGKERGGKPPRKTTVSNPPKKATAKVLQPKHRADLTQSEVEAKCQQRLEYDRQRSKSPERREYRRVRAREERQKAKELGLCVACNAPAIPRQTRCPTCAEKHRVGRT